MITHMMNITFFHFITELNIYHLSLFKITLVNFIRRWKDAFLGPSIALSKTSRQISHIKAEKSTNTDGDEQS